MLDKYFPLYIIVFLSTLSLTAIIEKRIIPLLSKNAKQPIYEGGPAWHTSKSGTPTMGGLGFLFSASFVLFVSALFLISIEERERGISLLLSTSFCILNSLVGVIDDLTKLKKKENAGLTPTQKILLQLGLCALFFLARSFFLHEEGIIRCSLFGIELTALTLPLMLLIFLGLINCANLTDGIDGLASCVAFSIGISLFYICAARSSDGAIISVSLIGATIGFLIFNLHPAKIFMGDTGSLFLGSLVAVSSLSLNNSLLIIPISGIYVIEGISVIAQVLFYKATKKRLLKMAPLHHHLEKCGLSENTICVIAILLTLVLSLPAFIFS